MIEHLSIHLKRFLKSAPETRVRPIVVRCSDREGSLFCIALRIVDRNSNTVIGEDDIRLG